MNLIFRIVICLFLCIGILNAQHLKKDGTPDMRYRENRNSSSLSSAPLNAAQNTSVPTTQHLKNDGTPDMRYRENRELYYPVATPQPRDSSGRFVRTESEKTKFLRSKGYTKTPLGYEIDHIKPLSQGGVDTVENMQLLSIDAHKAKTARERAK